MNSVNLKEWKDILNCDHKEKKANSKSFFLPLDGDLVRADVYGLACTACQFTYNQAHPIDFDELPPK